MPTRGNTQGIITLENSCGSFVSPEEADATNMGRLNGRYHVTQWPNADQLIQRNEKNGKKKTQRVTPGSVLHFNQDEVYITANTSLATYEIELVPLFPGDEPKIRPYSQWQQVLPARSYDASEEFDIDFRLRVAGRSRLRILNTSSMVNFRMVCNVICGAQKYLDELFIFGNIAAGGCIHYFDDAFLTPGEDYNLTFTIPAGTLSGSISIDIGGYEC